MSKRNVVHVEIPAASPDAAGQFYNELFGWKIMPMPEMNYVMWEAEDGSGGGLPGLSDESQAGRVLVYIASDDIDADLDKVKELGGKILREKTEIPGMGWYGIFEDPTGNALGIYTAMAR